MNNILNYSIKILINIIHKTISLIDKFEDDDRKLIKSFEMSGISIKTDTGYKPLSHIHLTKPFEVYSIKLENGYELDCADEHILYDEHMCEKYAKDFCIGDYMMTDAGSMRVVDIYINNHMVCMCDVTVDDDNHRFYSNGILSHNTTTSAIFMLHYILFNVDKNSLVLGDKRKTAIEILSKVKSIYYELPYFLKPGIYKWNENEIVLDNGCRCMAEATTPNSGISFTFHCVLADEFAKINKNIQETFYSHLFPTITAASARFMISSTVNGKDLFYRLYMAAKMGENDYAPFEVTWDRVPEWDNEKQMFVKRDEAWHQKQIANYGSEESFESQFGINFDITSNSLINRKKIQKARQQSVKFINKEMPGVCYSNYYFWHPDIDLNTLKNEYIIIPIDIAEGLGGDYTVFNICRVIINKDNKTVIESIGFFRSNAITREEVVKSFMDLCSLYLHPMRTLVSIERNTYGELFVNDIKSNIEKEEQRYRNFDMGCIVKYYNENMTKYTLGIKITSGNKTPHCRLFQEDFERDLIINNSDLFVFEMENFCDDSTGHFKASFGHDDMVMSMVQLEFVKKTIQYKNFIIDFEEYIDKEPDETIYNPYDIDYIVNSPQLYNMFDYNDTYMAFKRNAINRMN